MPELPEVEAGRRLLHTHCVGFKIVNAEALEDEKVIEGCSHSELEASLLYAKLLQVHRRGKHLWFETDCKPWPLFHFGMTGGFVVRGEGAVEYKSTNKDFDTWPPRFYKLLLEFDNGKQVAFTDPRRFARIRLRDDPLQSSPILELGPDPMHAMPLLEDFDSRIQRRQATVKSVLLDQSFIAGIGNWIADEVLYQAAVHPSTVASNLTSAQVEEIWKKITEVISLAVEVGARKSKFPDSWLFHHRWGKVAGEVGGHPIEFLTVGGRTTAIVPAVQRMIKFEAILKPCKGINSAKPSLTKVKSEVVTKEFKTCKSTKLKASKVDVSIKAETPEVDSTGLQKRKRTSKTAKQLQSSPSPDDILPKVENKIETRRQSSRLKTISK
eukprot:CAMPEP_0196574770 /NCGR_PEP_ID=MMETSP1081-20130531/4406_1 /TAXON_ID=36882 /ORGANISM="Pyramimonas amylifera, Strain CCMP720" /LENGTH=381 /DNA_ID=CAMNT_0041892879 /DNA_START=56 /DNA_END=1201 /DNA_ORIENTATION=+